MTARCTHGHLWYRPCWTCRPIDAPPALQVEHYVHVPVSRVSAISMTEAQAGNPAMRAAILARYGHMEYHGPDIFEGLPSGWL